MKKINAFQTSDGKVFGSEKEAMLHETTLDKAHEIDLFLSSDLNPYRSIPQRVVARSSILNWELWKENNAV
jgi:hypothetical protein